MKIKHCLRVAFLAQKLGIRDATVKKASVAFMQGNCLDSATVSLFVFYDLSIRQCHNQKQEPKEI